METRMASEPSLDRRMLMSCVIVDYQMQLKSMRRLVINLLEKSYKLLMPVSWHTFTNHLSIKNGKGRSFV